MNTPGDNFSSIRLLQLMMKWKKQLITTGIGALVVSFIFTLPQIMPPLFKAETIIYPVNIQTYSKETPTEQMVQLLESEDVRMKLVDAFDLYNHYEIDSTGKTPRFEMMQRLDENISVSKTEFESIEITVTDEDPKKAAAMCDSLLAFTDAKAISLLRIRAHEIMTIFYNQMVEKKSELDSLENEIKTIRTQYGITDFENMVEGFSREYYRSAASGGASARMETTRKNLEEHGGDYIFLKEMLWKVRGQYAEYKLNYEKALSDSKKELEFHNTISKAVPPEKKDSPKRTLIMLVFTMCVLFTALLVIIYLEHYSNRLQQVITP